MDSLAKGKNLYSQGLFDEAIFLFLNSYKENPFIEEGREGASLAKETFRIKTLYEKAQYYFKKGDLKFALSCFKSEASQKLPPKITFFMNEVQERLDQKGKTLYLEAYALEENNPKLAREKYKAVLDALEEKQEYYQKAIRKLSSLP